MFGWSQKTTPPGGDDLDTRRAAEFYRRGDFAEALRRADVILAVVPHVALSWRFKGECLFELERYAEAVACFRRAAELGGPGTEDLFLWQALALHGGGQPAQAAQVIRDFLASGTGTPELVAKARGVLAELRAEAEPPTAPDPAT
jgi:tetratricopeptide (TPR) repeat protein